MELDASLKLLDLNENASLDDAKQAYMRMQRLIAQYYQDSDDEGVDDRQADLELLSNAYDRALTYISEKGEKPKIKPRLRLIRDTQGPDSMAVVPSSDASFGMPTSPPLSSAPRPESDIQTVEAALAVISKRLHEAEAALPEAQRMVDAAAAAVDTANRHHERVRQESINAIVAAKSARIRSLLLEIEAKRAMEKAAVVAEKAKKRVEAATQMSMEAKTEADKANQQVEKLKQSEEAAAAESVNAEKQLELARARLKSLTHDLVETRNRMKISHGIFSSDADGKTGIRGIDSLLSDPWALLDQGDGRFNDERKILAEFLDTDAPIQDNGAQKKESPVSSEYVLSTPHVPERRCLARIVYPSQARPVFFINGRGFSVVDLSGTGMRINAVQRGEIFTCPRIVRGTLHFPDRSPLKITGKVVRESDGAVALRLVTHIGKYILDAEHRRLNG